jgi:hypothetical protein
MQKFFQIDRRGFGVNISDIPLTTIQLAPSSRASKCGALSTERALRIAAPLRTSVCTWSAWSGPRKILFSSDDEPGSEHSPLTGNRLQYSTRAEFTASLQKSQVQKVMEYCLWSYPFDRGEAQIEQACNLSFRHAAFCGDYHLPAEIF